MLLYELGVDEPYRRRGVGHALVLALADRARALGCYGMWVLTEEDNRAAIRTYESAGAAIESEQLMLSWQFGQPDRPASEPNRTERTAAQPASAAPTGFEPVSPP